MSFPPTVVATHYTQVHRGQSKYDIVSRVILFIYCCAKLPSTHQNRFNNIRLFEGSDDYKEVVSVSRISSIACLRSLVSSHLNFYSFRMLCGFPLIQFISMSKEIV